MPPRCRAPGRNVAASFRSRSELPKAVSDPGRDVRSGRATATGRGSYSSFASSSMRSIGRSRSKVVPQEPHRYSYMGIFLSLLVAVSLSVPILCVAAFRVNGRV